MSWCWPVVRRCATACRRSVAPPSSRGREAAAGTRWSPSRRSRSCLALVERAELVVEVAQAGAQVVLTVAYTLALRGEELDLSGNGRRQSRRRVASRGWCPRCRHGAPAQQVLDRRAQTSPGVLGRV